jgi:hypothetical protein
MRARTRRETGRFRGCRLLGRCALFQPHCDQLERGEERLLLLFDFENVAALIVSAFGAGAMRHFSLVAVRALAQRMLGKKVMRAPPRGASFGVTSFWIWHIKFFVSSF